jgi:pyruvate kinase
MKTSAEQIPWRRTKIVCTLGPATDAPGVLEGMLAARFDVARINASFGDHDEHTRRILRYGNWPNGWDSTSRS